MSGDGIDLLFQLDLDFHRSIVSYPIISNLLTLINSQNMTLNKLDQCIITDHPKNYTIQSSNLNFYSIC